MPTQERTMRLIIALGVAAIIAVALFANKGGQDRSATRDGANVPSVESAMEIPAPKDGSMIAAAPRTATVSLRSTSDVGEYGTATLTDLGKNRTRITISMVNAPNDATQPANIHGGPCKDLSKEPQYALNPVIKGRSVTTLSVNMGALIDDAVQSIRVRTDAVTAGAPYAACGDMR